MRYLVESGNATRPHELKLIPQEFVLNLLNIDSGARPVFKIGLQIAGNFFFFSEHVCAGRIPPEVEIPLASRLVS